MPRKVAVIPRGPAMGSAGEFISKVIEVAIRHNNYVVRPDFYRACLYYGSQIREVIRDEYGSDWNIYDKAYRLFKMASSKVVDACNLHPWRKCERGAWFKDIGVAITHGDYWFCLTLFADMWDVEVIPVE